MQLNLSQTISTTPVVKPAVKAAVQYLTVTFGNPEWAVARIILLDADNVAVAAHDAPITLAESAGWTGDDAYILKLSLAKLGIKF